jgi:hypothetical protein
VDKDIGRVLLLFNPQNQAAKQQQTRRSPTNSNEAERKGISLLRSISYQHSINFTSHPSNSSTMVSQLSSRILGGHSIASSTRSYESCDKQHMHSGSQNDSSSASGYSADKEGSSMDLPPVLIDFNMKQTRKPTNDQARTKRRRVDEQNFCAATAAADLARAGRPYPKVMTKRSRIIPSLDLSGVKLVSAKSVASSPFLHTTSSNWSSSTYDILTDFGAAYTDLYAQSSAAYQPSIVTPRQSKSPTKLEGGDTASASSVSDTASDDSHATVSPSIVVINARLDDSLKKEDRLLAEKKHQAAHVIAAPSPVSISMEEAVGVCGSSR